MTKHAQKSKKTRGGTADKVWAVGLAGATCLGLVGVVGARTVQEAAATPAHDEATLVLSTTASAEAVSTSGLTEAQLDEYARALEVERLRLEAYHAELLDVAAQLQESADSIAKASTAIPAKASGSASNSSKGSKGSSAATSQKQTNQKQTTPKQSAPKSAKPQEPAASAPQSAPKPAPKPVAKPAPAAKPAPQQQAPQATTRGS